MSHHTMSAGEHTDDHRPRRRISGVGRVLVFVYGVLALAATGRSVFQIIDRFHEAPVAFTLSGLSAVVYIVATIALVAPGRFWYRVAWVTISFELAGVLVIGALSLFAPQTLGLHDIDPFGRDATVWSVFGMGYLFIPLVLPILGLFWLSRHHPTEKATAERTVAGDGARS
ncbi:hypothetical protein KNO15_17875 [Leifsonia shinshuensis]|uniref:hypothetical protein n=1 Tax=Leifsonia shinshuensis TaxID=150026 RepID=UPI001F50BC10|nr:hypothetical protein [Leifsonia shinshuensis]MCI0158574.1 hypothetical protein [Leifsonia shinshuensis]